MQPVYKKDFFSFFFFTLHALCSGRKKGSLLILHCFAFFFSSLIALPFHSPDWCAEQRRREQPEVRCPPLSRLTAITRRQRFITAGQQKYKLNRQCARNICTPLLFLISTRNAGRGQQLWLETRSVQVYVCDPVTRTTAFPQSLNKDCAARVSVRCFFFFFFMFVFPLFFRFPKRRDQGEGGGGGKQETVASVLAARRKKKKKRKGGCRNWTTRDRAPLPFFPTVSQKWPGVRCFHKTTPATSWETNDYDAAIA